MTLAYDPTALQNGWVVCRNRLKTVPALQENRSSTQTPVKCCSLLDIREKQRNVANVVKHSLEIVDVVQLSSCFPHTFLCLLGSFYSSPYSLAPNRMIAQTSLSPYMHSPVSSYQVRLFSYTDFNLFYYIKTSWNTILLSFLIYRYTARPGCTTSHTSCSQLWVKVFSAVAILLLLNLYIENYFHVPMWSRHLGDVMDLITSVISVIVIQTMESILVFLYISVSVHWQGTVLTPTMDHAMSIQPTSMMGPLTQQLSHLSLGSTGTVSNTVGHTEYA